MLAIWTALKSKVTQRALVALFVLGVLAGAFRAGQKSNKADTTEKALVEVETKAEIDAEVSGMSAAARRDELRKWSRQ